MSDTSVSYLDLSDEDFAKAPLQEVVVVEPQDNEDKQPEDESVAVIPKSSVEDIKEEEKEVIVENKAEDAKEEISEQKDEIVDNTDKKEDSIDYKAEYERLTAPFKANGRDISVSTVDEAIQLMQMGANYSKKMAALKPHLRLVKMLEKHQLLDESKLSYLIDLQEKNPAAISKLVKDSGVDPLDMDQHDSKDYRPKNRSVDDREVELDMVLDEIKESPAYQKTLSTISSEWDSASKQAIADTPQLIKVINAHMESGIFDLIQTEMEKEKLFGRLNGLSDIEAYRKVGDAIQARGGFDFLKKQQSQAKPVIQPKTHTQVDEKLNDKRKAAAPVKAVAAAPAAKEFNPLAMSDDEFMKAAQAKFR